LSTGLVLFAHGSRDARWALPFEALRAKLDARGVPIELAYLELMEPDLETALRRLQARGVAAVRLVPVFLGQGGHVRNDLPRLAAEASARLAIPIQISAAVGENDQVLDAIVTYCCEQLANP
jgi:sirohydrochlorin cobaltochelatase